VPLYTFYPTLQDEPSQSFASADLADDTAAEAFALTVLHQHPACSHVQVWSGERQVCTRRREEGD
jgi:hypothetical protein